jgi:hypothetical protein
LQNEHALRKTARKPSLLLLYEGARMLLEGKDCRLLSLMNGAEVIVEKIILNDNEAWAESREIHPNVTQLKYMPSAVVVRVPDVDWVLPPEQLGFLHGKALPEDLRGIFIVRPDTTQAFKVMLNGIKWKVRRTQLNLIPANAIIVYGAQGESFDSAIVDLGMPPGQSPELFWLACYVMLTRCKDLSGLLILRLPPRSALKVGPPANVKAEMARLIGLASKTEHRLHKNLQQFLNADLPENISNLFSATSSSASTDVDWKHIEGQLAKEVAERQLHLTPSDPEPQSAAPRRGPVSGPMKRSSKGAALAASSGPRKRVTGKRSPTSASCAAAQSTAASSASKSLPKGSSTTATA